MGTDTEVSVLLNRSIRYRGIGDRLDAMGVGKILAKRGFSVRFYQPRGEFEDFNQIRDLFELQASISYSEGPEDSFHHDAKGLDQVNLLRENSFPLFPVKEWAADIDLPENFVTAQFDGKKKTSLSNHCLSRVFKEYENKGCEIIHVGGDARISFLRGKTCNLKTIAWVMSRARYHIGIDSGMMNLAKFTIPPKRIHIYGNTPGPCSSYVLRLVEKGGRYFSSNESFGQSAQKA